jgi:hypothetical protein
MPKKPVSVPFGGSPKSTEQQMTEVLLAENEKFRKTANRLVDTHNAQKDEIEALKNEEHEESDDDDGDSDDDDDESESDDDESESDDDYPIPPPQWLQLADALTENEKLRDTVNRLVDTHNAQKYEIEALKENAKLKKDHSDTV